MRLFRKLSTILFLFSIFIIINSKIEFTGAVVGVVGNIISNGFAGLFLILVSGILFFIEGFRDIKIRSSINKHKNLCDFAEEATNNRKVQKSIDHLTNELVKGNLEAGLGKPGHIDNTNIFYLRARNGARLYYRRISNGYEIVGKSSKGRNQDNVMNALRKIY